MPELMKPGEAMGRLGVSRKKLAALVAAGALTRVQFRNRKGKSVGYSWFRREEVERMEEGTSKDGHEENKID